MCVRESEPLFKFPKQEVYLFFVVRWFVLVGVYYLGLSFDHCQALVVLLPVTLAISIPAGQRSLIQLLLFPRAEVWSLLVKHQHAVLWFFMFHRIIEPGTFSLSLKLHYLAVRESWVNPSLDSQHTDCDNQGPDTPKGKWKV